MLATAAIPSSPQIYRQYFTAAECKTLDASPLDTALSEIEVLRVLLLRLLAAARASEHSRRAALGRASLWANEHQASIAHPAPKTARGKRASPMPLPRGSGLSLAQHISMLTAFSGAGLILASLVRFHNSYFPEPGLLCELLADLDPDDL